MANGGHDHWAKKYRMAKTWKEAVGYYLMGKAPRVPFQKVKVVFTRCSSVEPDDDGLVHGFKPLRDALVRYGFVVDDKRKNMEAVYRWEHAPSKKGHVRIEITGIEG